jgi:monoterpene epsilon-lactone hydrolase
MAAMLARRSGKGKDRSRIGLLQDAHDQVHAREAILDGMSGEVLAFPQAPDGVEIRHLRAFVAVAEELNFGRAAARLYLSQPALSRQIRSLERLLGCELLRRSTHRVELTVAGSALLDRARRLLQDLDEAISATQSVGGELAHRMAALWAPVLELAAADRDIQEMRTAYETFLAQTEVPETVTVVPANARGVPALTVAPKDNADVALLFLHGGGFAVGSAYGYRPLVGALVSAAGTGALVPDYRLAPEHPFPAAIEDALSAYRWLADQRGAENIVVAGDSIGGALVCSLLLSLRDGGAELPAGAVLLCPGCDLDPKSEDDALRKTAEAYLNGHPVDDPIVSPLHADLTGFPPLLIQSATGDFVLEDCRRLHERAQRHGVDSTFEVYPAETHVFHVFWSFLPEAGDALARAGAFIRERLGRGQEGRAPTSVTA